MPAHSKPHPLMEVGYRVSLSDQTSSHLCNSVAHGQMCEKSACIGLTHRSALLTVVTAHLALLHFKVFA